MAGEEMINLTRLGDYNNNMLRDAHILKRSTAYVVDDKVNKGLIYLQCITAGITAATRLDLTGVAVDDELQDGAARWKVLSITGVPTGAGGGMSLKDWKPNITYEADSVFVYENEIYKALVKHTSPSAFIELPILEEYTPIDWQSNTLYNVGDIFIESGVLYEVLTSFTSGATFSVTSDIDVYTPKTFAEGVNIYIDDIVLYNSAYYKALYDFVCGDTFSLYAFEKYVPHELTEEEINKAIQNFNPAFSGSAGLNYSTEEQRIGTWIDGKPLYQKTIVDTMPTVSSDGVRSTKTIDVSALNINVGVDISGIVFQNINAPLVYYVPINSVNNSAQDIFRFAVFNSQNNTMDSIFLASSFINDNECPVYITIKYTKTTD